MKKSQSVPNTGSPAVRKYREAYLGGSPSFVSDGHANRNHGETYLGGGASVVTDGHANVEARTMLFYLACGTGERLTATKLGQRQASSWTVNDASRTVFDGGKAYRMRLPANIPSELYWSVTAYDTVTRLQIENGTPFSRISTFADPEKNGDGSTDLYLAPKVPSGKERNWVKTMPGRSWFFLFRLYGPTEGYLDRSWKPEDVVEIPGQ